MPTLFTILIAPFIGSFLGVVIRRLRVSDGLLFGRSRCPSCGTALGPLELVPLASFVALRGRCRHCRGTIDGFHPAVELASLGIAIWAASLDDGPRLIADCALGWTLLALAWIDAERFILPDPLTLPLILAGLIWCWFDTPELLALHAGGAIAGFLLFRAIALLYRTARGREGLGTGDAKLLAAGGAWTGIDQLGSVILMAALAGLAFVLARRLGGRRIEPGTELPFGPFLALAIWLVWLYAARLDSWDTGAS